MPTLANPRHEAFAKNRAAGLKQYESYINAGFEGNPQGASQIERRVEVAARIQELMTERQEARRADCELEDDSTEGINRTWVLSELKKNVREAQKTGQISAANKAVELMMDMLNLVPKKGGPPPPPEEEKLAQPQTHNDDRLGNVLDKLEQLGGAPLADGEA